jgi:hypothetical protein
MRHSPAAIARTPNRRDFFSGDVSNGADLASVLIARTVVGDLSNSRAGDCSETGWDAMTLLAGRRQVK